MNIYTGNGAKRQENDKSVTVGLKICFLTISLYYPYKNEILFQIFYH